MWKVVRYTLIAVVILLAVAGIGVFVFYRATQHVPDFYTQELAVAPETQESDSDLMLKQATTLHNELHRRCQWKEVITAKAINAWLAVDLPKNHPELLPPGMHDPRVRIGPEGITTACRLDYRTFHGVISLQVSAFVESANVIGLRVHKARLGAVPWSLDPVLKGISDAARQNNVHIVWRQIDGDPVALLTLTPVNGGHKNVVHIDTISLEEGQLVVAGTTEVAK